MLTAMRLGLCALFALSACYAPTIAGGVPCDPDASSCPSGQSCQPSNGGHVCTPGNPGVDAGGGDAAIDAGANCFGSGLLGPVCLPAEPTRAFMPTTAVTINTATVGGTNCTEIRPQSGGPSLCLITAGTVEVPTGLTVRMIGPNPVVLLAARTITLAGAIDVSSHFGETLGGTPVVGAGARSAADCNALGVDGANSTGIPRGGGGAAGGSFGGLGAAGGDGRGGTARGTPRAVGPPTVLVGGCPGGHGGDGSGGGGGGDGGNGGGAVFLVAGGMITITGSINASGSGGVAGTGGLDTGGGGGGGGAGGMIGLDAPRITVTGSLFANGGGGGGGNGDDFDRSGQRGGDPASATVAAAGGNGGQNGGGAGGAGSVRTTPPGTGSAGSQDFCAGGGGGGGAGLVRIFGVPASTVTGAISPPAT